MNHIHDQQNFLLYYMFEMVPMKRAVTIIQIQQDQLKLLEILLQQDLKLGTGRISKYTNKLISK